jgi:hypothetical protein
MKTILVTLMLLVLPGLAVAQDVGAGGTVSIGSLGYYANTMTHTVDSIWLNTSMGNRVKADYYTIVATATGADTIDVYTLAANGTTWVKGSLIDLSTNTAVTQIIASTTSKEFLVNNPRPSNILLLCTDASASIAIVVAGR